MADWSKLQHDLLGLIVSRFNMIEDYLNFGSVCKSWHSVAKEHKFNSSLPRVPWLMLAEDDDEDDNTYRKFYSLYNGMIYRKRIPEARGKRCVESLGWLVTVGKEDGEISLLHPFSGVQVPLPHQNTTGLYHVNRTRYPWTFVQKAVLSANPSHTSDYVLMVIEGSVKFMSFWRPGDLLWTKIIKPTYYGRISDVVYFNGNFYAVDDGGSIQVCDADGPEPTYSRTIARLQPWAYNRTIERLQPWADCKYYILESLGSLFVVAQSGVGLRCIQDDRERIPLTFIPSDDDDGDDDDDEDEDEDEDMPYTYGTRNFVVFHIDLDGHINTPTRDLGDRAFFLGANASLSVQASQFPGIKPNHVYFTDNCLGAYLHFEEGGGLDMGVFNLADGSIQPHYDGVSLSRICPPIWVTPTLC